MSETGSYIDDEGVSKSTKDDFVQCKASRPDVRAQSKLSDVVRESLQACSWETNYERLEYLRSATKSVPRTETVTGMQEVYDVLNSYLKCGTPYMTFGEAYEVFMSFQSRHWDHAEFRDALLNDQYGLAVFIFTPDEGRGRFVIAKKENSFFPKLAELLSDEIDSNAPLNDPRLRIDRESVHRVLNGMDTEWDKQCAKALLLGEKSRSQVRELGFKPDSVVQVIGKVQERSIIAEETMMGASDMVKLHLRETAEKLQGSITEKENLKERMADSWSKTRLDDLQEEIEVVTERLEDIKNISNPIDESAERKRAAMVKRKASELLESNRVKRRKLGAGRHREIDSEDEEYIAKHIEEKSTTHGRRHDQVSYLHHRVKYRSMLNIINYRRFDQGRRLIRSATTLYNRSKPRNIRSLQGRKHLGRGLWCAKKPPKAEDCDNENTHHQRAHAKNIRHFLFSEKMLHYRPFCFARSIDDKAYVRPGTSEGFEKSRNVRTVTVTDETKSRKLPKYDFPERLMYVTPATHRILRKEGSTVDGVERIVSADDQHFVIVRPKAFVDSSGTTWANETEHLRVTYPQYFEVDTTADLSDVHPGKHYEAYSVELRSLCARIHDDVALFKEMTMREDYERVERGNLSNPHTEYEMKRIDHFLVRSNEAKSKWSQRKKTTPRENALGNELMDKLESLMNSAEELKQVIANPAPSPTAYPSYDALLVEADIVLQTISSMNLPPVRPRWADFSDAGPGVGCNNFDVRFRDAEFCRIHKSDYRIRVHRSRGDSGQNEAERTNSAAGDALVDGGTLTWEKHKQFEGMSDEQVSQLSTDDLHQLEYERMERNAWWAANEVSLRIDDAPVLSTYMTSFVTECPDSAFFFNKSYVSDYRGKAPSKRITVPGSGYISKVVTFMQLHYDYGELYMEFIHGNCANKQDEPCEDCNRSGWIGPPMEGPIPRPVPNKESLPNYHYKSVFDTPSRADDGKPREVDDHQPRANIRSQFAAGKLNDPASISAFSSEFIVEENLVKGYIEHLQCIQLRKQVRTQTDQRKKQAQLEKSVDEYNWVGLLEEGKLGQLRVYELKKYLCHHNIRLPGAKKADMIKYISEHLSICGREPQPCSKPSASVLLDESPVDEESDSDDDLVAGELDSSTDEDN